MRIRIGAAAVSGYWEELERPGPDAVDVGGTELRRGSRVRLHPRPGADVFDLALAGKVGIIEGIEQDTDGAIQLAVTVEDDPGRDLGERRQPGHLFFFSPEEVEPLAREDASAPPSTRVLVAGIGNVFMGDDGFGVALAGRLAQRELPPGVDVVDFGIRGMDLAYAMQDYEAVVLLDASPRGEAPGTLYVIEPEVDEDELALDTHGMDPVKVLALSRTLGDRRPRVRVVGCEPGPAQEDIVLSEPVRAALDEAVRLVEAQVIELMQRSETEVHGT
jgi:hydrogenase maturation protease